MIRIYGHSDDVVCLGESREPMGQGMVWENEIGPGRSIVIGSPEAGGVAVTMFYAPGKTMGATWAARVRQLDEGIEIPWPVTISNAPAAGLPDPKSYSVLVTIDCPLGTRVAVGKKVLSP